MSNKKGFTLVELIAVIVILAIVVTIAAVTITNVREKTLETQYKNLQTTIKTAAQSYHEETGIMRVPVVVLLQNGKLEADEIAKSKIEYETETGTLKYTVESGDPVIYDPREKGLSLNCDYIDFNESEKGKYISVNNKGSENGCEPAIIGENSVAVQVTYKGTTETYSDDTEKWYALGNNEELSYKPGSSVTEYVWTSDAAPDEPVSKNEPMKIILPDSKMVDTHYTLTTFVEGGEYSKTFRVRADGRKPVIEEAYLENAESWSQEKSIYIHLADYESGLDKVYLSNKNDCSTVAKDEDGNELKKTYSEEEIQEDEVRINVSKNATYYVCAVDKAGNKQEDIKKITISKIDTAGPEMTIAVSEAEKYRQSKTITVTITDKGPDDSNVSGFNDNYKYLNYKWSNGNSKDDITGSVNFTRTDEKTITGSFTVSGKTGNGTISFTDPEHTIEDYVGNYITNLNATASVKLDNTKPSCGSNYGSTSWTNKNVTITIPCTDEHSGCTETFKYTYTTDTTSDTQTIHDDAGNTQTCTFDVKLDKTAPSCGTGYGATSWSKNNRSITIPCTDGLSGCKQTYKYDYTTNKTSDTKTISDNAGNTTTCTFDVKVDKTAPTCGTVTGASTSWTNSNRTISVACTDTGGSGCSSPSFSNTYNTTTQTSNISISDSAGNSTSCPVNVYVDKTAPSCGSGYGGTSWTKNDRTITIPCTDTGSGCKQTYSYTYSTSKTSDTKTISDNAGNTQTCSFDVKVDKTAPSCGTVTGGSTSWTNSNRTVSVACTDSGGSGCSKASFSSTYNSTTKTANISISDSAGNTKSCSVNVYVDKTKPTCGTVTGAGSSSSYTTSRTVKVGCSDSDSGCKASTYEQTFSGSASSATTTSSITIYDYAGNSQSCSVNVYVCGTGSWGNYGSCSSSGWKTRTRTTSCPGVSTSESAGCNSSKSCGNYGSCSNNCGSGTMTRSCWHYNSGNKVADADESSSCEGTTCPNVTCYLIANGVQDSTHKDRFYYYTSPNKSVCYISSHYYSGTSLTNTTGYKSGVGSSGSDRVGVTFANGKGASNHVKISNGQGYYACPSDPDWCKAG